MNTKKQEKDLIYIGLVMLSVLIIFLFGLAVFAVAVIFFPNPAMYSVMAFTFAFLIYSIFVHKD